MYLGHAAPWRTWRPWRSNRNAPLRTRVRGGANPAADALRRRQHEGARRMREISHFINGAAVAGAGRSGEVFDPNTGEVQAHVAFADAAVMDRAVKAASAAQPGWAAINPQRRARVMFEF